MLNFDKYSNRKSIFLIKKKKLKVIEKKFNFNKEEFFFRVIECGVCSSDLKFFHTGSRIKKYPIVLGHEICAEKIKYSKEKNKVITTGDFFVFGAEAGCGKCEYCKFKSKTNLCDQPISIGSNYDGGFSNIFSVKKKIFKNLPKIKLNNYIKYSSLSESVACVINGLEVINFKKNDNLLVLGAGYMGILFVNVAKIFGAKKILVVDYNLKRLKIAKKIGADYFVKIKKRDNEYKIKNEILKKYKKIKFNKIVSSNSNYKSHELAIKLAPKLGEVNLYGGISDNKKKNIIFDSNFVHYNQIKITGSFSSSLNHLKKACSLIKNKKIKFNLIGIKYASYENIKNCFEKLSEMKIIKCIFRP